MIDPKHMQVELPTNVDDVDINSSGIYGRPLDDVFTDMTYHILRINLSISIREIVDASDYSGCNQDDLSYNLVLLFDKKINESIRDCAAVANRNDSKGRLQHNETDKRLSKLRFLQLTGEFCGRTKLTRLHGPYLARGTRDPKYAYSRMICLRSARCVIELGQKIIGSDEGFELNRIWIIVHYFWVSVLVLVMDYFLNREESQGRKRERPKFSTVSNGWKPVKKIVY